MKSGPNTNPINYSSKRILVIVKELCCQGFANISQKAKIVLHLVNQAWSVIAILIKIVSKVIKCSSEQKRQTVTFEADDDIHVIFNN